MKAGGSARGEIPSAHPPRLRRRLGACVVVMVGAGFGLTGCADSAALGLVHQACHRVDLSLALYQRSLNQPDAAVAARDKEKAEALLQDAVPLATQAAGEAPQWQALMATVGETSRLPESDLVPALQAQCSASLMGGNQIPSTPDTTLPPPPGTTAPG
jgi:hypothetical protein